MIRDELVSQVDLVDAIKEALERKGVYPKLKSQLRTEVYHILEDKSETHHSKIEKPKDLYLASELIRELFMSFGLNNSLSVFNEEMGQPEAMMVDREFISGELGLSTHGTDSRIPLFVLIIQHLMKEKNKRLNDMNESLICNADQED